MGETDIEDVVKSILLTTDDTYEEYIKLTKENYVLKELIFEELNKPFSEIEDKYIDPFLRPSKDTFEFYYKGMEDEDLSFLPPLSVNPNAHIEYQMNETMNWVDEKKKDVLKILNNYNKYKTFDLKVSNDQKIKLYNDLMPIDIIPPNTKEIDFVNSFSGRNIDYQPKIIFLESKQTLIFLLSKLMCFELLDRRISYDSILIKTLIFVQSNGNPFSRLASSFSTYEDYSPSKFKNSSKIFLIDKKIKEIFH